MKDDTGSFGSPLEQSCMTATPRRRFSIGLPACTTPSERRFPITPEGARMLVGKGYSVKMESGAAETIHYSDNAYTRWGTEVTSRSEALSCDIVIHLAPLDTADIRRMRRGTMLLTLLHLDSLTTEGIRAMTDRGIVGVAIDNIADNHDNLPFADILAEIDGRAAIATASSLLADSVNGKGILLGGVAGVIPCEVTVIGSGIAAIAAARSACGLGATVRMFDDDVYSLRSASRDLGPQIIGSAIHEKVLMNALASADVIVATSAPPSLTLGADAVERMKKGVITFDLTKTPGQLFPSLPTIDLAMARATDNTPSGKRACYINAGSAVPRTAAMALSNTLNTMLDNIIVCEGLTNALKLTPGLRRGVFTFFGKVTDRHVAEIAGCRATDINIFLQLS